MCACQGVATDSLNKPAGIGIALGRVMSGMKRFVYVIKTEAIPPQFYVGLTSDVDARLADQPGCAAVLSVAFPQLVPRPSSRA